MEDGRTAAVARVLVGVGVALAIGHETNEYGLVLGTGGALVAGLVAEDGQTGVQNGVLTAFAFVLTAIVAVPVVLTVLEPAGAGPDSILGGALAMVFFFGMVLFVLLVPLLTVCGLLVYARGRLPAVSTE